MHKAAAYSISCNSSATLNLAPVLLMTSSTSTPGASSVSSNWPLTRSTWKTHYNSQLSSKHRSSALTRSVMIVLTQFAPVKGRLHSDTILGDPSLAVWLVATTIFVWSGFEIKSMAPPIPLNTLPGIM